MSLEKLQILPFKGANSSIMFLETLHLPATVDNSSRMSVGILQHLHTKMVNFEVAIQILQDLPITVKILAIPIVSLLLWRFIRFTVLPVLRPNAPKELPHWFPSQFVPEYLLIVKPYLH
jgi:hypothetical protein